MTCCLSAALGKGSTGFGVTPASSHQVTRCRESPSPPCRVHLFTQDPPGLAAAQAAPGRHPVSSLLSQPHLVCEPDQGRRLGWKPPVNLQGSAQPGTGEKQGLGCKPERKLSCPLTASPGETSENQHSSRATLWGTSSWKLRLSFWALFSGHIFFHVSVQGIPAHQAVLLSCVHLENSCSSHGIT